MNSGAIDWTEIISDKDLVEMYKTKSLLQMDKILGVSYQSVGRKLKSLGVVIRGQEDQIISGGNYMTTFNLYWAGTQPAQE